MKKIKVKLSTLSLKKEMISGLSAGQMTGGGPVTWLGASCWQTCQYTCTLDGTIASRYVSNCCPAG